MQHEPKELEAERGEPKEPEAVDDELGTEQAAEEASGEKVEAADGEDASAKRCRLLHLYWVKINDLKSQEVAQRSALQSHYDETDRWISRLQNARGIEAKEVHQAYCNWSDAQEDRVRPLVESLNATKRRVDGRSVQFEDLLKQQPFCLSWTTLADMRFSQIRADLHRWLRCDVTS